MAQFYGIRFRQSVDHVDDSLCLAQNSDSGHTVIQLIHIGLRNQRLSLLRQGIIGRLGIFHRLLIAQLQLVYRRQSLDQRADRCRIGCRIQLCQLGDAGIQLIHTGLGHICLCRFRQGIVSRLGFQDCALIVQSHSAGILQLSDHGFHIGNRIRINCLVSGCVEAGDQPLALNALRGKQAKDVLGCHISGQLDLVPTRLQFAAADSAPAVIVQPHDLRGLLGIVDVEEQILVAGQGLIYPEATLVCAGACLGDVQCKDRAVFAFTVLSDGALARRIRREGHAVGCRVNDDSVAFDLGNQCIQLSRMGRIHAGLQFAQSVIGGLSLMDLGDPLHVLRQSDLTCLRQCVDQIADLLRNIVLIKFCHSGNAGIQLIQIFLGNQSLGRIGQFIIRRLGRIDCRLILDGQLGRILQVLDHGFHIGHRFAVNQSVRHSVDAGDLPLANHIRSGREDAEDIAINGDILRQFDQVPARIQRSGAQILPVSVGVQEHDLRRLLGIVDVEEHMLTAGHILGQLEAACIICRVAGAGDVQAKGRTVGRILQPVPCALAGSIRCAHCNFVRSCVHSNGIALDGLQAGAELCQLCFCDICLCSVGQSIVVVICLVDGRNDLYIHRHLDILRLRQCVDLRAHFLTSDRQGQNIHSGNAGIQFVLACLGNQGLCALRQSFVGGLGSLNSRSVRQSQCVCILQSLDHGFHLCGDITVNQFIGQRIKAGDLPLAHHIGCGRENTKHKPLNLNALRQFDQIPAGLQGSGAQILPAGVGIQEHDLRRLLGIVNIEEHFAVGGHVLGHLEATCVIAGAGTGDVQVEHGTVGFIFPTAPGTFTGSVSRTHSDVVLGGIHHNVMTLDSGQTSL